MFDFKVIIDGNKISKQINTIIYLELDVEITS